MVADILQESRPIAVRETVHGFFFPPPASLPPHSGAFPRSSLGVSNHSLAATKRRFPAGLGADDDPALAAATNGDFVSADKGVK